DWSSDVCSSDLQAVALGPSSPSVRGSLETFRADARSFRPGPLQTTTVELGAGGTPLDVTSAKRRAFRSGICTRILSLRLSAELPFCEVQGRGRPIPRACRDIRRGPCMSRTAREARPAR